MPMSEEGQSNNLLLTVRLHNERCWGTGDTMTLRSRTILLFQAAYPSETVWTWSFNTVFWRLQRLNKHRKTATTVKSDYSSSVLPLLFCRCFRWISHNRFHLCRSLSIIYPMTATISRLAYAKKRVTQW